MNTKKILSENLLNLGKIHLILLNASHLMGVKKYGTNPPSVIKVSSQRDKVNEFGKDEINWWVFKREHDIPALRRETEKVLESAQLMKDEATKLSKSSCKSLEDLRNLYTNFADQFSKEITVILSYVEWLKKKDELAPTILYNYRIWGTTRMTFRNVDLDLSRTGAIQTLEKCALTVLGLMQRESHIIAWIEADLEGRVPAEIIQEMATNQAVSNFVEYFEHFRDSLRNVLLEIDKRESEERLLTSDDFWRDFVIKSAQSVKTEQKYWDFKQTLDMWHIKTEPGKSEKANKFSEIVAGFANNQGGVIVVGVTDTSPRQIVGLTGDLRDIENFMKHTRSVISQYIPYDKDFVHLQQVNVPDLNGVSKLCLVIVIQQTVDGLSVKGVDGKSFSYPVREETGLVWKDQNTIREKKIGTKSDNYNFLSVLQQFVNEEI